MKKSFMTKVLATGLSVAMAFSLTAATNVTTAAAAAKPAMKASQMTVKEGKSRTFLATAKTLKTYKITKAVVKNASAKQYISVKKNAKGTGIVVTGKKAADTARKIVITFKNKNTKKTTTLTTKVVVKAVEQEEELTMSAAATGVKKVTVTFNKAVASDTKITLTKGTTTIAQTTTFADDAKSATLALDGKLTAGTYTVTAVAADKTLTATIETKDEALTSFELGSTLKQTEAASTSNDSKASAVISFKALNQYGETMNYQPKDGSVTVSIGKVGTMKSCKTSGAGTITVTDIPQLYAIAGQSFTFVLVDTQNNTGVTLNTTAVYGQAATPKTLEFAGVYSTAKNAFKDIADDDKISDYELLFTAKDQYGDDMDSADVAKLASNAAITVTVAGGLTNITTDTLNASCVREVGDKTYFAVPLKGASATTGSDYPKANAGTATVTIVNNTQGVVYTGEFTVTAGTVIDSITISQKDTIYASEDNEMEFSVIDTNGNNVTDYATLKGITFKATNSGDNFYWKKNADGSAKLIYAPAAVADASAGDALTKIKNYDVRSVTITANKAISGNLKVYSKTFNVYHAKVATSVSKITASTVCLNGNAATVNLSDIVLLDQWYNKLDSSSGAAKAANVLVTAGAINPAADVVSAGATDLNNNANVVVTNSNPLKVDLSVSDAPAKIKLNFKVSGSALSTAQDDGCDATFTKGSSLAVTGLKITSVNNGYVVDGDGYTGYSWKYKMPVEVKGYVNGVLTTIPTSQYKVVEADANGYVKINCVGLYKDGAKTETNKIHVVVDTTDGEQTLEGEYTVSNAPSATKSIAKVSTTSAWGVYSYDTNNYAATGLNKAASGKVEAADADSLFVVYDQYGEKTTGCAIINYVAKKATLVSGSVVIAGETKTSGDVIDAGVLATSHNGSAAATAALKTDIANQLGTTDEIDVELEVTATSNGVTATETMVVRFGKTTQAQ